MNAYLVSQSRCLACRARECRIWKMSSQRNSQTLPLQTYKNGRAAERFPNEEATSKTREEEEVMLSRIVVVVPKWMDAICKNGKEGYGRDTTRLIAE